MLPYCDLDHTITIQASISKKTVAKRGMMRNHCQHSQILEARRSFISSGLGISKSQVTAEARENHSQICSESSHERNAESQRKIDTQLICKLCNAHFVLLHLQRKSEVTVIIILYVKLFS